MPLNHISSLDGLSWLWSCMSVMQLFFLCIYIDNFFFASFNQRFLLWTILYNNYPIASRCITLYIFLNNNWRKEITLFPSKGILVSFAIRLLLSAQYSNIACWVTENLKTIFSLDADWTSRPSCFYSINVFYFLYNYNLVIIISSITKINFT